MDLDLQSNCFGTTIQTPLIEEGLAENRVGMRVCRTCLATHPILALYSKLQKAALPPKGRRRFFTSPKMAPIMPLNVKLGHRNALLPVPMRRDADRWPDRLLQQP